MGGGSSSREFCTPEKHVMLRSTDMYELVHVCKIPNLESPISIVATYNAQRLHRAGGRVSVG